VEPRLIAKRLTCVASRNKSPGPGA